VSNGRVAAEMRYGSSPTCAAGCPRAEDALAEVLAAMKQAEARFDAANDCVAEIERAFDEA